MPDQDFQVRAFDTLVGKHGDHIGGERDAVRALLRGETDAACILDANHLAFAREGQHTASLNQNPRSDGRLRSLQLHRARRRATGEGRPFLRAAARDVVRRRRSAPAARSRRVEGVGARPGDRIHAALRGRRSIRHDRHVRQQRRRRNAGRSRHRSAFAEGGYLLVKRAVRRVRPEKRSS